MAEYKKGDEHTSSNWVRYQKDQARVIEEQQAKAAQYHADIARSKTTPDNEIERDLSSLLCQNSVDYEWLPEWESNSVEDEEGFIRLGSDYHG